MLVKLQKPITPRDAPALAYTERKAWQRFLPMTPALEAFFGDRLKVYVEAELVDGDLVIAKAVPDQPW